MNTGIKFELMQKVFKELEDLKENQAVMLKKVEQLEADSIALVDTQLEMKLDDLYETAAMNLEKLKTAFSFYQQKLDEFANENQLHAEIMH